MIVVDTSAIVAILLDETEGETFIDLIAEASETRISTVSMLEACLVMEARKPGWGADAVERLIVEAEIEAIAFSATQVRLAHEAWRRFGRGRHRASLNFGDCCAYALAKEMDADLLYKGIDFAQTDIASALRAGP